MGLDITYYRKLVAAENQTITDHEPEQEGGIIFYANPDFPGRDAGIPARVCVGERAGDFRAGSYGSYDGWRETLAELAGYTPQQAWRGECDGKPFVELVNFSDCEGVIGPVVSAKLAADFRDFDARAKSFRDTGADWFYDRFCKWREAFETAADGGAVDFH